MDDVVLNKAAIIERCIDRAREVYAGDDKNLKDDLTKQDSILLNLQRACEATIDLGMHLVRIHRLGIPQESRDAFQLLFAAGLLPEDQTIALKKMVGFRNVAIHQYQDLNLEIVKAIIEQDLDQLKLFVKTALRLASPG